MAILKEEKKVTKLFTIGSNGKTAKSFFELLKNNAIDLLIDIRLNNNSQLSGFSKGGEENLGYLLKEICSVEYIHDVNLAPTEDILDSYHLTKNWGVYVDRFNELLILRDIKNYFKKNYSSYKNICLLCSEASANQCHRRLVAEYIKNTEEIIHL